MIFRIKKVRFEYFWKKKENKNKLGEIIEKKNDSELLESLIQYLANFAI